MQVVAELTGIHCNLWLHYINDRYQLDANPDYQKIVGHMLDSDQAEYLHEATQGGLPDFGFILGSRWDLATRAERQNYNFYFARLLNYQFQFSKQTGGNYCALDISLTLKDQVESSSDNFVELPQPRLFQAKAYTLLPGKEAAVPVVYSLEQDAAGWHITEITAGNVTLAGHYSDKFIDLLAEGGFAHLTAWLINQVPQQTHTTTPARPE